jgi:hypothetical protein
VHRIFNEYLPARLPAAFVLQVAVVVVPVLPVVVVEVAVPVLPAAVADHIQGVVAEEGNHMGLLISYLKRPGSHQAFA